MGYFFYKLSVKQQITPIQFDVCCATRNADNFVFQQPSVLHPKHY